MRKIKRLTAIMVLATVASLGAPQAFAGEMGCPGIAGPTETPGFAGEIGSPGVNGEIQNGLTGDMSAPGAAGDVQFPGIADGMWTGIYAAFASLLG
ncbi:MAG TPA: hypothetical protein VGX92_18290 [Pyrinomonadaceae bacterium]|jgi:hypothetical protein|nr:hypothetical protein [Pyrinomonadaceae bacterium]